MLAKISTSEYLYSSYILWAFNLVNFVNLKSNILHFKNVDKSYQGMNLPNPQEVFS